VAEPPALGLPPDVFRGIGMLTLRVPVAVLVRGFGVDGSLFMMKDESQGTQIGPGGWAARTGLVFAVSKLALAGRPEQTIATDPVPGVTPLTAPAIFPLNVQAE
jgi:hypothetical protein